MGADQHTWPIWWLYPEGQWQHEETAQKGKRTHTKPSFRSRTNKPRPRRGDSIAKVVNHMGEENPQEPAEPEQAGAKDRQEGHEILGPTNCGSTTTGTARQHTQAAEEARRRQPLAKLSDKPGKGVATRSSDKPKEDVQIRWLDPKMGGYIRKETTTNVNLRSRSSDKKTLLTQRVTTSRRNTYEKETVEASHTNQVQRRGT